MKFIQKKEIKNFILQLKTEGLSMQRRFILYIISAIAMAISLILLLLNVFGIINHTNTKVMDILDTQLTSLADDIENDYDKTAAYALSFSEQLSTEIFNYLTDNNLTFDELKNNPEALTNLQTTLYDTVYLNMQLAPSSGAFYILDTTVNSTSETPLYNGIYLKYINLYSESTVNNAISLYRGSYDTGKNNGLTFHSGWQNEISTNFFDSNNQILFDNTNYILSSTVNVPDTWERARYIYVPIYNYENTIIGICGFEINDLYFQLARTTSEEDSYQTVVALFDEENGSCTGQFNSSRFNTSDLSTAQIYSKKNYTIFDFGSEKCIGKHTTIEIGNTSFTVAIMITEAQYNEIIKQGQLKTTAIFLIVTIFAFTCCKFMSKKYVAPILQKLIYEKDVIYEKQLQALENEKATAEAEAKTAKLAYEQALKKLELAKNEINQLAEARKEELNLEEYEYFINNLNTLTPAEAKIYELYLDGKKAREITTLLNITENTLKYHNKNIYSKLGISSRKQLLRYATLKHHEDNTTKY